MPEGRRKSIKAPGHCERIAVMMNFQQISGGVTAPKGFKASGVHCGIRKNKDKKDLGLICSDVLCGTAAVYTQNKVKGAPILVTKRNIANGKARAVIVNSGNANTCNADGEQKAQLMCELAAKVLNISAEDVIVASTGVIGQPLPIEPIAEHVEELAAGLSYDGGSDAAVAIMTTDTKKKEYAISFEAGGKTCAVGGMAKGSGMIHPNMATMLCFITTDVSIGSALLQQALTEAVNFTFNMISIDGDTSTNDMVSILASGLAGNQTITGQSEDYNAFLQALKMLCVALSRDIAKDGEGATKLLECNVMGAKTVQDAKTIAKSVIGSSLVKAAMFGADANCGRVLCAMGYADAFVTVEKADVSYKSSKGTILVCQNGVGLSFSEEIAKEILLQDEIEINITLYDGDAAATAWGCDLTYDYVKINGDYRT